MAIHTYTEDRRESYVEQYCDDPRTLLHIEEDDAQQLAETICQFYRDHLDNAGMDGYIVGLSGGIDSATVAYLLVEAVGADNVYGVILPAEHTREDDVAAAQQVADELGIAANDPDTFRSRIDDVVDDLEELGEPVEDDEEQRMKRGNLLARCRMIVLRDVAKARNALVAGTTNASERDLGYMTLAADGLGGIDNEALYNLYKTTVRDLAAHLGVPEDIIEKQPTADLWQGQTDTDELGFSYDVLDQALVGIQLELDDADIVETIERVTEEDVRTVRDRMEQQMFKRELPLHPMF